MLFALIDPRPANLPPRNIFNVTRQSVRRSVWPENFPTAPSNLPRTLRTRRRRVRRGGLQFFPSAKASPDKLSESIPIARPEELYSFLTFLCNFLSGRSQAFNWLNGERQVATLIATDCRELVRWIAGVAGRPGAAEKAPRIEC